MGPMWMHAKEISGMPINHNIWMRDPPSSSYPPCIAVKCAALQSSNVQENYLRLLREAFIIIAENISRHLTIFEISETLGKAHPEFNVDRFRKEFYDDSGWRLSGKMCGKYNIIT